MMVMTKGGIVNDLKVIDITLSQNARWRERFERYRQEVMVDPDHNERWRNYTESKLDIADQLGAFLTIDASTMRIVRFESVYRPPHWPERAARICNRTWVDPTYRAAGLSRARNRSRLQQTDRSYFHTYHHQLECCRAKNIGLVIISRENAPKRVNSIKAIFHQISKVYANWRLLDDAYLLVSPHRKTHSCWQKIIWYALAHDAEQMLSSIPTITCKEFQRRFGDQVWA